MDDTERLALTYQIECGIFDGPYTQQLESQYSATQSILESLFDERCIGPLVRFSHCRRNPDTPDMWHGSLLLGIERGYDKVSMSFRTTVVQGYEGGLRKLSKCIPSPPTFVRGHRLVERYGYHFWRFDMELPLYLSDDTDCFYKCEIVRNAIANQVVGRFRIASSIQPNWNVLKVEYSDNSPAFRCPGSLDDKIWHLIVLPQWSTFFLENKVRAERHVSKYGSIPYTCQKPLPRARFQTWDRANSREPFWESIFGYHERPKEPTDQPDGPTEMVRGFQRLFSGHTAKSWLLWWASARETKPRGHRAKSAHNQIYMF